MLAGMIAKNITGFNVTAAYEGMRLQATDPSRPHIGREGLQDYITLGWVHMSVQLSVEGGGQ